MINYAIYNQFGEYVTVGTAESIDDSDCPPGHFLYVGSVNIETDYWDFNQAQNVNKGPAPGLNYQFDYQTKTWVLDTEIIERSARQKRSRLLQESDWTALSGAEQRLGPTEYQSWQTYRQALRDITQQQGWPTNIVWPTK